MKTNRLFAISAVVFAFSLFVPAQSLTCSNPGVTYDVNGAPTVTMACLASGLGSSPHTFNWDTGKVSFTPFVATGLDLNDSHGSYAITNSLTMTLCDSDCSLSTVSSMSNTGQGTYSLSSAISYTVASAQIAGSFHVDDSFTQCGPFGLCSFQVSIQLH